MASQLVEQVGLGNISVADIVSSLRANDCSQVCLKLNLPEITSTKFIYEFLAFLRSQSRFTLENAPVANAASVELQKSDSLTAKPSNHANNTRCARRYRNKGKLLPKELTRPLPCNDFIMAENDFPSIEDSFTINTPARKAEKSVPLHSTPMELKGNLEAANAPLALENIFTRSLPKSQNLTRKRASLTSSLPQTKQQPQTQLIMPAESPKKRITPIPVKRWQQTSKADFAAAEVSHSPNEVTKHQREVVRCLNQETTAAPKEEFDTPDIKSVTSIEVLERFAQLYAQCLISNLVPNIYSELSFIMQLMVIKLRSRNARSGALLTTASNCGYFAARTLLHCNDLLCLLEPSTLSLLKSIPHVEQICPNLHRDLIDLCSQERSFSILRSSFLQGVSFDATVDSSENFPNAKLFGAFRKQRDAFYDLLKDWQKVTFSQHHKEIRFNSRVAAIFELSMDPCNLLHLAKLFILQMVATCCGSLETDELGNTSENTLQELRSRSPEKFSKLRGRLEKPAASSTESLKHQFTGHQAFFYNFILVANYAQFHEHLKNVLVSHLFKEDRLDISPEDADTSIDSQIREELYTLLYRLRVYGAFLGLLEFLPYSSSDETNPENVESQRSAREHVAPRIELERYLRESIEEKRILPTLSWLATYFSMADTAVGTLPAFETTFKLLNSVFLSNTLNRPYFILNRLLVGWIFQNLQISINFSGPNVAVHVQPEVEAFVDIRLIYMLCPFMSNLKSLLAEFYCPPLQEARKVIPMTAPDDLQQPNSMLWKLEEAFYFMHPSFVKKTINFIVERVPAYVVKTTKPLLVEQFREEVTKELQDLTESGEILTPQLSETLSQNLCPRFQLKAENIIMLACDEKAGKLLDELLRADCTAEGVQVATKICARHYHVRILRWIRCYISKDYIYKEIRDISKSAPETQVNESEFENRPLDNHLTSDSVCFIIDSLEHLLRDALVGHIPSWREVLAKIRRTMEFRREWKSAVMLTVCHMLIDVGSVSIATNVNLEIANAVVGILKEANYVGYHHSVDSPRNRYIIEKLCQKNRTEAAALLRQYQQMLDKLENQTSDGESEDLEKPLMDEIN